MQTALHDRGTQNLYAAMLERGGWNVKRVERRHQFLAVI
jgi:hypothetical protein